MFIFQCARAYVEFEINQGAYNISCPDAQCPKQGTIQLEEIEALVSIDEIEKHHRYRLNKGKYKIIIEVVSCIQLIIGILMILNVY